MNKLSRLTGFVNRFAISVEKLGIIDTIKIFLWGRVTNKQLTISLPNGFLFGFEGKNDYGVVSHFYSEGYFIEDSKSHPINRIIDAGANIGTETARFLFHHPDAEIVAIEPSERNYFLLEKNFVKVQNVNLIKGAVWSAKTNLKVISGSNMESFKVFETQETDNSIPAFTILEIMEKFGWDRIDILKLDIEGSEYEVFSQNYEIWIDKVNVFIFEVPDNDRLGTTQVIYRALSSHKYNTYACGENLVLIRADMDAWKLRKVTGFNT